MIFKNYKNKIEEKLLKFWENEVLDFEEYEGIHLIIKEHFYEKNYAAEIKALNEYSKDYDCEDVIHVYIKDLVKDLVRLNTIQNIINELKTRGMVINEDTLNIEHLVKKFERFERDNDR